MARSSSRPQRRAHTMPAPRADQLLAGPILPQPTRKLIEKVRVECRHAGLQLDKLSPVGDGTMEDQKDALVKVRQTLRDEPLLKNLLDRRRAMLHSLGAARLPMTTRGPLTLHLSRSGALENAGIALHPVYGFVYLPGSGIKGLIRAYAETVWAAAQPNEEQAWRRIEEAFGWSPGSERHKKDWRPGEIEPQQDAAAGRLVFHDAWPTRWPRLILDVVNNHHVKYYAGEDDPGDWEDPTLVYFLALNGGEKFEFAISDRKPNDDGLLKLASGWLKDALTAEGAGAKTAAGYGRFKPAEGQTSGTLSPDFTKAGFASASFDLKLATPAFLAGADQKREDCDLRPATLRGLLRWWWRTMHAAHLDRDSLKKLETAVWGDAEAGSPMRIAVDNVKVGEPEQYNKNDPQFQSLPRPSHGQQVTQGLFYASYGMAERHKRWFCPDRSLWRITLTARRGYFQKNKKDPAILLPPDQLLEQAAATLWLLCRFGGAGSRSRKGFGSFDDIEVEGIGSKEDCIASAKRLRQHCKLDGQQSQPVKAPSLEEALILEQRTEWTNSWYALDQTGMVLQRFAKSMNAEDRIPLGLPRRVGRSPDARNLKAKKGERYASPALWSLATCKDGTLLVRLIAFPAAYLPDKHTSKATLQKLIASARQELRQQAQQSSRTGGRGRGPSGPRADLPKANERVQAELLEEKTKKGGWKAKHVDSGLQGPIQDPQNTPADAEPGQCVELTVAYVREKEMGFKWAAPPPKKKVPAQGGGRRQGGNPNSRLGRQP